MQKNLEKCKLIISLKSGMCFHTFPEKREISISYLCNIVQPSQQSENVSIVNCKDKFKLHIVMKKYRIVMMYEPTIKRWCMAYLFHHLSTNMNKMSRKISSQHFPHHGSIKLTGCELKDEEGVASSRFTLLQRHCHHWCQQQMIRH